MKKAMDLDEPELDQLLLWLVPQRQQDQYELIKGTILINLCLMLNTLERINKMDKFPEKSRKWQIPGMGREKWKLPIKMAKILKWGIVPPGIVLSVLSMVEPNQLTIL